MGTEKRDNSGELLGLKETPGPGSYVSKSFMGEGPKVGIKQRNFVSGSESSLVPGPGAYQPELATIIRRSPTIGLGHSKRDDAIRAGESANVPGPGYYLLNGLKSGPQYKFGTGQRIENKRDNVPGPGYYEIPSRIGEADLPPHERSKHY